MRTIRARLAASYVVALVVTMFLFAVALYLVQRGENVSEEPVGPVAAALWEDFHNFRRHSDSSGQNNKEK